MKIRVYDSGVRIECKRAALPFMVEMACPACGSVERSDFCKTSYAAYPVIPGNLPVYFSCTNEDCYHEWETEVHLSLNVTSVESTTPEK
jgi:hypothetical protein